MHLKKLAGWNQLPADWELLLEMSAGGTYLASFDGRNAGTVTTIPYGNQFSWIGMVLVVPELRGLGIGTGLLKAAIRYARRTGAVLLDATPKGRKLYLTLGFVDNCALERLEIDALPPLLPKDNPQIQPIEEKSLPAIIDFDAAAFGARREILLRSFYRNAPEYGFVAFADDRVTGYSLGRHGSHFEQIGPLVAENGALAQSLFLRAAWAGRDRPVIIDILKHQADWRSSLLDLGFRVQRPFTRMRLGEWSAQRDVSRQFAIAGPEFG